MLDSSVQEHPPFCFRCGYDLTGLDLPHRCPECGNLADPEAQTEAARRWFAGWRTPLWWLASSSRIPGGLCYVLSDSASVRLARWRIVRWLAVPVALSTLLVAVGACVTIQYRVKTSYYDRADPERKPLRVVTDLLDNRLYHFNLHLFYGGRFFFRPPAGWSWIEEWTPVRNEFSLPDSLDLVFVVTLATPWMLLGFGYCPSFFLARVCAGRAAVRARHPELVAATKAACSLLALPVGAVLWGWLFFIGLWGATFLLARRDANLSGVYEWGLSGILAALAVTWILTSVVAWPRLVGRDEARIIFPLRAGTSVLLAFANVGLPAVALAVLIRLLN